MANAVLGFTLNTANVGAMTEAFSATVAGTVRGVDVETLTIMDRLSAPTTATVLVRGFTPAQYSDVRLYNGGTGGVCLFGGTAVKIAYDAVRLGDDPWHKLECQDYTWLLNRYLRVNARYSGIGINTALSRILASYTNGGFRVGYCPASMGSVGDITFTDATVTSAIDQLATVAGGFWDVDPDKRIHIFSSPDHLSANGISLSNNSKNFAGLNVTADGSEIATKVIVLGDQTQTTALVAASATTIPVEDCEPFTGGSGVVLVDGQVLAYTGVSVSAGPGSLTGVTGLARDIPQGAAVRVRETASDSTAQSDLATLLGGLSGVAELTIQMPADRALAAAAASAELAKRKSVYSAISYTAQDQVHTGAALTVPGQTVDANLTSPTTLTGTYRVQEVEIRVKPKGTLSGTRLGFERRVKLGPYFRGLNVARRLAQR